MIPKVEIRAEPADGAATRALVREYVALLRDRLGMEFRPTERIVATEATFGDDGGAWRVIYEDGQPIGCGGLLVVEPHIAEIKRMFVTERARRDGHGRALLRELERAAAERGCTRARLLTTEVLSEARRLYAAEGYYVVQRVAYERQPVEIWLEKPLG